MNPNQAVGEGRLHAHRRTMRESGEALVAATRNHAGAQGSGPRLRRWHDGDAGARLGADVLGVDIARNLVEAGNRRAAEQGLTNCGSRKGRIRFGGLADQRSIWSLACSAPCSRPAVRCRQGDGARYAARRPHCDGQLDSDDPTLVAQILKDQLCVYASAAGRLCQPHDLGCGEPRGRSRRPGRSPAAARRRRRG